LRHDCASVLLDAGENIKAVSSYLGHSDAGFTLRTHTHLMPQSAERTRSAVDDALADALAEPGLDPHEPEPSVEVVVNLGASSASLSPARAAMTWSMAARVMPSESGHR
jgi:hypothetical protein